MQKDLVAGSFNMKNFFNFIKKKPWHKCFPVNFSKFIRGAFLRNTYER